MANKKLKEENVFNKYFVDSFALIFSWIGEYFEEIIGKSNYIIKLKKKIMIAIITFILLFASLLIILYGFGTFIASYFPDLRPGLIHIALGFIILILILIYRYFYVAK